MAPTSDTARTYRDVLAFLDSFTNYERRPPSGPAALGTARMEALLDQLDRPQTAFPSIHIAGTKGKGSTATMTAALLQAAGHRVGLYTSPHLVSVRERISIGGAAISREAFCDAFRALQPAVEAVGADAELGPPTYFEILTALAFVAFQRAGVDAAVVEVGMGGRFDATNVLEPVVAAITSISLDHESVLGDTLAAIAQEKAGVVKPGIPLVVAPQPESVMEVIREAANRTGSRLLRYDSPDFAVELLSDPEALRPEDPLELHVSTWRGRYRSVRAPLLGEHQAVNAGLAIALAESYLEAERGGGLSQGLINRAWRTLQLPGRIEIVGQRPWVVLDGAHNPASVWALAETMRKRFRPERTVLLFGAAEDKDIPRMLRILAPLADRIITLPIDSPRGADPAEVARIAREHHDCPAAPMEDPGAALASARDVAGPDGLVCIAGSLYLAGAVQRRLHPDGQD